MAISEEMVWTAMRAYRNSYAATVAWDLLTPEEQRRGYDRMRVALTSVEGALEATVVDQRDQIARLTARAYRLKETIWAAAQDDDLTSFRLGEYIGQIIEAGDLADDLPPLTPAPDAPQED